MAAFVCLKVYSQIGGPTELCMSLKLSDVFDPFGVQRFKKEPSVMYNLSSVQGSQLSYVYDISWLFNKYLLPEIMSGHGYINAIKGYTCTGKVKENPHLIIVTISSLSSSFRNKE